MGYRVDMNRFENMIIVIDTREQAPLPFTLPTERGTLATGDYSIKGLEDYIAIERKSIDDLVACLKNGNRERFERELSRGRSLDYFALVLECDLALLADHQYQSLMNPKSVIQSVITFSVRYKLPVFFCENRQYCARMVESLLQKYVREIEKKLNLLAVV